MPHFFVDDSFSNSKEVMSIPARHRLAAVGLWTVCGSWSANKLTDGFVPAEVLKTLGARPALVSALVDNAGLWERVSDGIRFTNWAKWQRTRDQVVAYRQRQAEKKRAQRERIENTSTSHNSEMSPGDTLGDSESCPPGTPQTPIPIPVPKETTTAKAVVGQQRRGHRIPENWRPSDATKVWARENHGHLDLNDQFESFMDHWLSATGANSRKLDWDRAFKNWLRNARPTRGTPTPVPNGHMTPGEAKVLGWAELGKPNPDQRKAIGQ